MNGDTIYHLHFKTGADFYFGSVAAIYDMFDGKVLKVGQQRLYEVLEVNQPYENKICIIKKGLLHRKQGGRGKVKAREE